MIGRWLSQFWFSALKKIIFKDVYEEIEKMGNIQFVLDLATDAAHRITETANQFESIKVSADQLLEITKGRKKDYEEFQVLVKYIRELNKDLISQFLITSKNQTSEFMKQLSHHTYEKNTKLLEQILEKINQQNSAFIEQISLTIDKQSTVFITQNSKLTKEILVQSIKNYGTINEKFKQLVSYPFLVTFREELIIIRTNLVILESLDHIELKTFHYLYLKYHKIHPEIPFLDMTHGVLVVKILFPAFFTEMLNNLSNIKIQLNEEDTFDEMETTIKSCNVFFHNLNKRNLEDIKTSLNSHISKIDKILVKLIDV